MISLFKKFKEAGKISEALLAGRNIFNRNPGNAEVFEEYFSYLCSLSETLPSLADRTDFANQAGVVLSYFIENADITEDKITDILTYQTRLSTVFSELEKAQQDIAEKELKERLQHNSKSLVELYTLKDKMQTLSSQKELDEILSRIRQIDATIDKEIFNQEQNNAYEDLTKSLTDLISTKMREFEKEKNIEYNKKAAESFALAFNQFRSNESKYRNQTQLFTLVSTSLFAYDASRLFNETLIYYNHVYSYIFSKLDDDGKLALTRFSFDCEQNRR